jgi:RNA recognition motif-containing protein
VILTVQIQCGEIVDIRFPSLKYNTHRRFCYVQFSSAEAAEKATTLDGQRLGEKERLVAKISAPNQKKDRSSATAEGREVYIRNIDFQAKEKDVKDIFSAFGKIEKIRLPPGPKKGTHKGFGFVVFESKDDADVSLGANGKILKSRALEVSIAQVNPGKASRPGNAVDLGRDDASPSENQPNGGDNSSPSAAAHASPGPTFDQIKKKTLGIMNLADTVNDIRLRALFEPFGPLRKVILRPDHQGAIVEYENVTDAGRASLKMDGVDIDGMKIEIGDQANLMKRMPEKKVTKGFEKKSKATTTTTMLVPASVRGGPPAANRGAAGAGRKRGLGFTGAVSRKDRLTPVDGDVDMKTVDESGSGGNENGGEKKGKSNDDFKKMFLGRK